MAEENVCQWASVQNRMLLMAARENMPKTINALLQEGADAEVSLPDGYTPLLLSAWFGHFDNIKILLANGADINARRNGNSGTALLLASQCGHYETVKLLLEHDADTALQDEEGDTAASAAQKMGHQNIFDLLTK